MRLKYLASDRPDSHSSLRIFVSGSVGDNNAIL